MSPALHASLIITGVKRMNLRKNRVSRYLCSNQECADFHCIFFSSSISMVLHQKCGFSLWTNSFWEFSNPSQLQNFKEFQFKLKLKSFLDEIICKHHYCEKKGEKSTKQKNILTMLLHQKWRFFSFNKFFLRVFKLFAISEFLGISI